MKNLEARRRANARWYQTHKDQAKIKTESYRNIKKQTLGPATYNHLQNMYHVKSKYGLTEMDLQDLLLAQKGCCKLCHIDFGDIETVLGRSYVIDHDHVTGEIRGLLCSQCNSIRG